MQQIIAGLDDEQAVANIDDGAADFHGFAGFEFLRPIHFGLGRDTSADSIKVTWPATGFITFLKNIKANQTIEIDEINSFPTEKTINPHSENNLLFSKSDNIIDFVHEQSDFTDFFLNQKILPHKFSQIGPVMTKGDIKGDSREDLIIGSTNKLPTTVILRKGNRFEKKKIPGLTTKKPFSEADLAIVDINKDGLNDVVAVAGGYENNDESEYKHYLYENKNGSYKRTLLPVPAFPASVVRPCDFNHDGYPDLFIGSSVKKGSFPEANNSWLIINDKGSLKVEPWSALDLGMVTDAVWSDYDNDGWEDLIITREWNSVIILKNMQGKELVPMIWNSIIAGDFDNN